MSRLLTQEEAEKKSLIVNIKMIGQYKLANTKTQFQCPFCNKIFDAVPNHIMKKNFPEDLFISYCKAVANLN